MFNLNYPKQLLILRKRIINSTQGLIEYKLNIYTQLHLKYDSILNLISYVIL